VSKIISASGFCPSNSDVSLADEFNNVKEYAPENRMIVNMHKTQEIAFQELCLPSTSG